MQIRFYADPTAMLIRERGKRHLYEKIEGGNPTLPGWDDAQKPDKRSEVGLISECYECRVFVRLLSATLDSLIANFGLRAVTGIAEDLIIRLGKASLASP